MKTLLRVALRLVFGSLIFISAQAWPADLTIPHTFVPGTPATAADVNENFSATATAVNNKQNRVVGTCPAGQAVQSVAADGSVTCEAGLNSRIAAMEAVLKYMPVGPQTNVPALQVALGGWTVCYSDDYQAGGVVANILSATCNKANLMLACRQTGAPTYTLLAQAPRADVTFATPADTTSTHTANGTAWYFNTSQSWGFAKAGDVVNKNSCDIGVAADAEQRLCWHAGSGSLTAGFRCGTTEFLQGVTGWERVILHRD
jgi:hypothetical protein